MSRLPGKKKEDLIGIEEELNRSRSPDWKEETNKYV